MLAPESVEVVAVHLVELGQTGVAELLQINSWEALRLPIIGHGYALVSLAPIVGALICKAGRDPQ